MVKAHMVPAHFLHPCALNLYRLQVLNLGTLCGYV